MHNSICVNVDMISRVISSYIFNKLTAYTGSFPWAINGCNTSELFQISKFINNIQRTFKHVHMDTADVANTGMTGILPRVLHPCLLDQEEGGGDVPLLSDLTDASSEGRVGDWMLIVIPEDVLWRLGAVLDKTCKVHCESFLQINVRTSQYLSIWFWKG